MITVRQAIVQGRQQLVQADIEDAALNADLMAAKALMLDRSRLPIIWSEPASPEFLDEFKLMVARRCRHEPLQYIIGVWGFLDFEVKVGPGALIPRPETEEVFLAAVKAIEAANFAENFAFADVGTGSGILGLALARRFSGCTGWLVDLSSEALGIARNNLQLFPSLRPRINLVKGNLLEAFAHRQLHVVISNPPYINHDDIPGLMPEVSEFEPHMALDGGGEGLDLIVRLISQAADALAGEGLLIFEHGHGQRAAIMRSLDSRWINMLSGDDLCGRERFMILQRRDY